MRFYIIKSLTTIVLTSFLILGTEQVSYGQSLFRTQSDSIKTRTLLSELGVGYAHTLSGRASDIFIHYNIGYKAALRRHIKLNVAAFLEGLNSGRVLINFGPKVGLQYNIKDNWKIAGRIGVGLLNNQDQKPGNISWEFNVGYEDQLSLFTKYNSYNTDGYANGEYFCFGIQMEGTRSLKTTAIVGGTVTIIGTILGAIISRSQ